MKVRIKQHYGPYDLNNKCINDITGYLNVLKDLTSGQIWEQTHVFIIHDKDRDLVSHTDLLSFKPSDWTRLFISRFGNYVIENSEDLTAVKKVEEVISLVQTNSSPEEIGVIQKALLESAQAAQRAEFSQWGNELDKFHTFFLPSVIMFCLSNNTNKDILDTCWSLLETSGNRANQYIKNDHEYKELFAKCKHDLVKSIIDSKIQNTLGTKLDNLEHVSNASTEELQKLEMEFSGLAEQIEL